MLRRFLMDLRKRDDTRMARRVFVWTLERVVFTCQRETMDCMS